MGNHSLSLGASEPEIAVNNNKSNPTCEEDENDSGEAKNDNTDDPVTATLKGFIDGKDIGKAVKALNRLIEENGLKRLCFRSLVKRESKALMEMKDSLYDKEKKELFQREIDNAIIMTIKTITEKIYLIDTKIKTLLNEMEALIQEIKQSSNLNITAVFCKFHFLILYLTHIFQLDEAHARGAPWKYISGYLLRATMSIAKNLGTNSCVSLRSLSFQKFLVPCDFIWRFM